MSYVKTTDPDYVSDPTTGVLINTSEAKLLQHKARMESSRRSRALEERIDRMERQLSDLVRRVEDLEANKIHIRRFA